MKKKKKKKKQKRKVKMTDPDNSMRQQDLISIQNKTYKMFLDIMHY